MPPRRAVELRVGGQTYRVVASGDDPHVQHLADLVDRKFAEVVPHGLARSVTAQQAIFLTAMALAAEVEEHRSRAVALEGERDRSLRLASRAKDVVARLLQRVDDALSGTTPAPPAVATSPSAEGRSAQPSHHPKAPPADPRPSFLDTSSPLDALTDPPDAIHESLLIDILSPPPRASVPSDVRQSVPNDVHQSVPRAGLRLVRQAGTPPDDDSR
jgi:cell division protein ZapA